MCICYEKKNISGGRVVHTAHKLSKEKAHKEHTHDDGKSLALYKLTDNDGNFII